MTVQVTTNHQQLSTDRAKRRYTDIRHLLPDINNPTPLVQAGRSVGGLTVELFLKLEWLNPFGSIKDRAAAYLLDGLARSGRLEGKDLVEASSGNTAIALAALAAVADIDLTVTIPEAAPLEKRILLRLLGAEVWETPDDLCPVDHPKDGAIALARSIVAGEGFVMPDQYNNPDNVRAHYERTGPEIWRQTDGRIRYFVAGLGTCGTITGVGRFLKEQDPTVTVIGVEPQTGHRIPGLKNFEEASEPSILDWSVVDEVIRVDDEPAYETTKRLHRKEGLLVGPSTGAVVHAAAQIERDGIAVGVSPDSSIKYTSYFAETLGTDGLPGIETDTTKGTG